MNNLTWYRRYLAMDGWQKRIDRAGVEIDRWSGVTFEVAEGVDNNRHLFNTAVEAERADLLIWADIRFALAPLYTEEHPEPPFSIPTSELNARRRDGYNRALFALLKESPEALVTRNSGTTLIYGIAFGCSYRIEAGQALCERVQTGTRTVSVPAEDAEMVEIEEPVFEWRCNDAELSFIGLAQ